MKLKFELTILGSSSALPTSRRNTTAQLLNHAERFFLIDCGEATQIRIRQLGLKLLRIDHIFISHLHGDHIFGLPGIINTFNLLGRQKELHIYAPPKMEEFLNAIHDYIFTHLGYPIVIHHLEKSGKQMIYENKFLEIYSFPVVHKIDTWGFSFEEKTLPKNLIKEKIEEYDIPVPWRVRIKNGEDFVTATGEIIPNEELTIPPPPPRKYVFVTDTRFVPELDKYVYSPDLLYHEATFLEDARDRALETKHSTAKDAGKAASLIKAKKLIIGHFSSRYTATENFVKEATSVFDGEIIAVNDGDKFIL